MTSTWRFLCWFNDLEDWCEERNICLLNFFVIVSWCNCSCNIWRIVPCWRMRIWALGELACMISIVNLQNGNRKGINSKPVDMEKRTWNLYMLRTHFPKSLREMSQGVVGIERLTRRCISASYEETLRKPIMNVGTRGSNRNIILPKTCGFGAAYIFFSERAGVLNLNDLVRLRSLHVHFVYNH